jgi:hypothetical protein
MIKSTNLLYIVFCFLEEKNIRIRVFLNICIYICYMVYIKKTSGSTRESIVYFWLGTCDFTIKSRKDNHRLIDFRIFLIVFFFMNKCGHRNVLSKRQVWMSIFHIINFKKKNSWTQGPGFFLIKN